MDQEQENTTTPEQEDNAELDLTNENIDEKLTEKEALAQAKQDGIEFVDSFEFTDDDGETHSFETHAAAKKEAGDYPIVQKRERKV